ncbi:hypothetical protein Nepgr_022325 [Nepenthes gracilis]|uniref:Uncharacterized protein n=1 Tax=Nepenthes gracilis TaxID=150966 RepID=A0AAD3T0I8_NEPGR|nr:hypothetical protein Nepgr_022325 [Nepenthes gracilis]
MDHQKILVDLSPFFIFESVGDSDAAFDPKTEMHVDDDYDAESCSSDAWNDRSHAYVEVEVACDGGQVGGHADDDCDGDDDGDGCDGIRRTGKVDEMTMAGDDETSEVTSTASNRCWRKNSFDSNKKKMMTEVERSRLFWETCLAS